jgi:SMC interacting uncharacterized protein involved in chromosome segregation
MKTDILSKLGSTIEEFEKRIETLEAENAVLKTHLADQALRVLEVERLKKTEDAFYRISLIVKQIDGE